MTKIVGRYLTGILRYHVFKPDFDTVHWTGRRVRPSSRLALFAALWRSGLTGMVSLQAVQCCRSRTLAGTRSLKITARYPKERLISIGSLERDSLGVEVYKLGGRLPSGGLRPRRRGPGRSGDVTGARETGLPLTVPSSATGSVPCAIATVIIA